MDPADLLAQRGAAALTAALASGQSAFQSLGDRLLTERLDSLAPAATPATEEPANSATDTPSRTPTQRWVQLARELDPRLLEQHDWPATAARLQQAQDRGHNVTAATRALLGERPLSDSTARDLRYRLVARLELPVDIDESSAAPTRPRPLEGCGPGSAGRQPAARWYTEAFNKFLRR